MKHDRYLINASNLHVGGGVQVATSVIGELTKFSELPASLEIWVSSEIHENLKSLNYNISTLPNYMVVDTFGLNLLISPLISRIREFKAIFTIFGPLYAWRLKNKTIAGFAQAWIIYPENESTKSQTSIKKIITKLKFKIQSKFYKKSNILVVELEHVKKRLIENGIAHKDSIRVINNCISNIYMDKNLWKPIKIKASDANIKIGFLGRNYQHKNTAILPEIKRILKDSYNVIAEIYVTFTDEEWESCNEEFRQTISNVGSLLVDQCPSFYQQMDAVIFPSLLECFSATPLEAMVMKKPLFASDRPFNRDICANHAYYFNPLDPNDAAAQIADYLANKESKLDNLTKARDHALSFPTAKDRATNYLEILTSLQ